MNQRTLLDRLLSPAGFALVLLLFFLPFFTVSCGVADEHVNSTFTGLDFVIGGQPHIVGPGVDADSERELAALFDGDYNPDPFAIVAAVVIFAGMVVGLINARLIRTGVSAGLAALGAIAITVALLRAPGRVDAAMNAFRASTQSSDVIDTSSHLSYGFWLVVVLLAGLAIWQGFEAFRTAQAAPDVPAAPPPGTADLGPPGQPPPPQAEPGS
jgi:hypothetical protein